MNPILKPRIHLQAFRELVILLRENRQLTLEMAKREITDRFVGQAFGSVWALFHPLVLMGVYVFVFAFVLKVRIGGTREMPLDYTTYLLSGLIPWLSLAESMNKAGVAITSNANLVKQVVFPIEVLPVKGAIASLGSMSVSVLFLIFYVLVSSHGLPWTYAMLPVLVFLQVLTMIGFAYILASVGVYFKDIKDFVQAFTVIGVFLMPIIYLPKQVPEPFRPIMYINPLSYVIWCYQDALYFGRFLHWWAWLVYVVSSISIFYVGYCIFRKLKTMFGNVI